MSNNINFKRIERNSTGWVPYGGICPPGFKSSTWHECSYFSGFISGFNGTILLVVGDVPIDSEAPMVTSSISRFAGRTQLFRGAHRGRMCMRAFIGVSVHSCM